MGAGVHQSRSSRGQSLCGYCGVIPGTRRRMVASHRRETVGRQRESADAIGQFNGVALTEAYNGTEQGGLPGADIDVELATTRTRCACHLSAGKKRTSTPRHQKRLTSKWLSTRHIASLRRRPHVNTPGDRNGAPPKTDRIRDGARLRTRGDFRRHPLRGIFRLDRRAGRRVPHCFRYAQLNDGRQQLYALRCDAHIRLEE